MFHSLAFARQLTMLVGGAKAWAVFSRKLDDEYGTAACLFPTRAPLGLLTEASMGACSRLFE